MVNIPATTATMVDDDVIQRESMRGGLVKFDGKFANQVQNPLEVPKFLQSLCVILQNLDHKFQLGDKDGNPMAMSAIPATLQGCIEKFNLQVVSKRNHQHVMFVTTIHSTKPFGTLKRECMDFLRRNNLWMNMHGLDSSTLDIAIAGWILRAHPRYHSPDKQRTLMETKMKEWWKSLSRNRKQTWNAKVNEDENGELIVPSFFVNARSVNAKDNTGTSINETAFLIMGPTDSIKVLMDVMEAVFHPDDEDDKASIIYFVPARLLKENPKTFFQLVVQQKRYIQELQNVSIAGMHPEFMKTGIAISKDPTSGKAKHTTLEKAFLLHPAISRIDPGSYAIPLGKWNLTTTKNRAEEAKAWIDTVIKAMPEVQRTSTGFPDFPEVTRMQASTPSPTKTSKYDSWAQEDQPSIQNIRMDNRKQPPSYSTNPQEAHVPPILRFDLPDGPSGSYAQAASRSGYGSNPAGAFSNNTSSTFLSTMSSDKVRGVETDIHSLKHGLGEMRQENAQKWQEIGEKMDAISTKLTEDTDNNSTNNRTTSSTTSSNMDTSLLQEILKTLEQSQANTQARFDSLEDQQAELGTTMNDVQADQASLRQVNEELLQRINKLEEIGDTPNTRGSPVRKRRPRTDDSPQNSTTNDSPLDMLTDDPAPKTSSTLSNATPPAGWGTQEDILEFSSDEEDMMDETPTQPAENSAPAGAKPACGS
jgi:hypothetical protein